MSKRQTALRLIDLAAVNGHHVPGTAYHWSHNWNPRDVRTALKWKKAADAVRLHKSGAAHFNEEPDASKFHEGVKRVPFDLHPAKPIERKPPEPPKIKAEKPSAKEAYYAKRLKELKASLPAEQRNKPHLWGDATLAQAASYGDERAALHQRIRHEIYTKHVVLRKESHDKIAEYIRSRGGEPTPYRPYSKEQLQDLERREVAAELRNRAQVAKREAAQAALEAAKTKAAGNPEALAQVLTDITEKNGTGSRYHWPIEDLRRAADAGDAESLRALPYAEKQAKRRATKEKAAQAVLDRLGRRNSAGDPVSKALEIQGLPKESKANVQTAIDAIDKVHNDGQLYPIPVKKSAAGSRYGQYRAKGLANGADDEINISTGGDHHALTMAHEVGHWLDARALSQQGGRVDYRSEQAAHFNAHRLGKGVTPFDANNPENAAWKAWWDETQKSAAITSVKTGPSSKYASYLLSPKETWARSYAQYIATRSGDPLMQKNVADIVALRGIGANSKVTQGYSQWEADDFEPIAAAIDKIIAAKGWTK